MNITSHTANLPLATVVNPPTEGLRRDNQQREVITQVSATNPSAAEKGVASEKERARTPAQTNEQVDFANLRKQAEYAANSISEQKNQGEQNPHQEHEQEKHHGEPQNGAEDKASEQAHEQELVDEKVISQLQQRDTEVRTHELAHATTGGAATGSPSYTFEVGPDGKSYAVAGEVSVDLSSVAGDPQATITKMQKVHAAALAPANPSTQDRRVAASATQKILAAQSELLAQKSEQPTQENSASSHQGVKSNTSFNIDTVNNSSSDFDTLMNQTLSAQEDILSAAFSQTSSSDSKQTLSSSQIHITEQSSEVQQRAQRVESFYFKVSQGYEKPDNFQFELTA